MSEISLPARLRGRGRRVPLGQTSHGLAPSGGASRPTGEAAQARVTQMAAAPPSPRHRPGTSSSHKGRKPGAAGGFPGSVEAPGTPGPSQLPASGTQPGLCVPLLSCSSGFCHSRGFPCLSSAGTAGRLPWYRRSGTPMRGRGLPGAWQQL